MPELPEVETTVRDLRSRLTGRRFKGVEVEVPRMVRAISPEALRAGLVGHRIKGVERRGKYILIPLDDGVFIVHLMMGGALRWVEPRNSHAAEPPKYTRLRFVLDNDAELFLVNPRTLGGVWLVEDADQVVGHLGPEPLKPDFTPAVLAARLKGRAAPIKPLLLDQGVIAGIGNIYADESLFLAGIRPERPADELTPDDIIRLHHAIREALEKGVRLRGTSLGDFFDPSGEKGSHQTQLNVFRQEGKPCLRCGATIQKRMFRGRGTHFCPNCQK